MEPNSEYFVIGDTAYTPLEVEVAPMTIKGKITGLMLLARCMHPPFYLVEGQVLAQTIPIPAEILVFGKSPEVYWAEVVGENKPSLACNLACGSDRLHVEGVLDSGADVTVIPESMWPSHWELQPVAGKLQGIGGITMAKISKNIVQIEGPDGKLANVCPFVAEYKASSWGRDTMSQWGVQLVIPKTPQDFGTSHCGAPTHKLKWLDNTPKWVAQWPLSKEKLKALEELVEEQVAQGHLEETTSPWNFPVSVIKKPGKDK
ncbi:hypothetical protein DUI87_00906 [Hirundo rustica rustica]|uniref:Peptidase A2 domain-containing protein n=1 Tax=Hirundo rustica rustica TaxID=333673 RepID=A0A3M0LAM6_HIRRU|nr:hypothetical protein DUI87_00906 [Hirundo rustica rustica]